MTKYSINNYAHPTATTICINKKKGICIRKPGRVRLLANTIRGFSVNNDRQAYNTKFNIPVQYQLYPTELQSVLDTK